MGIKLLFSKETVDNSGYKWDNGRTLSVLEVGLGIVVHVKQFTSKTQQYGKIGEDAAAAYLLTQGFEVAARNVAGSFGEIDIIARRQGIYYFFEVKAGRVGSGINPAESLTETKIRKVAKTAAYYAMIHRISEYRIEGIIVRITGKEVEVERIELF